MKKWFLLIPLVVLISGCTNTRTYWSHHSKPQEYTYRDIADCEVSANSGSSSYSYRGDDEVLHLLNEWQSIDKRTSIFNNCMTGKGYFKVTERIDNKVNYRKSTSNKRYIESSINEQKKNAQSCNEMPYEEWLEHSECTENYKDLDDLPLESLKYKSGDSCDEMSIEEWLEHSECTENYRDLD